MGTEIQQRNSWYDHVMGKFQINFLDHVAIRARDIENSKAWYEKIVGLLSFHLHKGARRSYG